MIYKTSGKDAFLHFVNRMDSEFVDAEIAIAATMLDLLTSDISLDNTFIFYTTEYHDFAVKRNELEELLDFRYKLRGKCYSRNLAHLCPRDAVYLKREVKREFTVNEKLVRIEYYVVFDSEKREYFVFTRTGTFKDAVDLPKVPDLSKELEAVGVRLSAFSTQFKSKTGIFPEDTKWLGFDERTYTDSWFARLKKVDDLYILEDEEF